MSSSSWLGPQLQPKVAPRRKNAKKSRKDADCGGDTLNLVEMFKSVRGSSTRGDDPTPQGLAADLDETTNIINKHVEPKPNVVVTPDEPCSEKLAADAKPKDKLEACVLSSCAPTPAPMLHLCRDCNAEVDTSRPGCRLVKKSPETFQCRHCNITQVVLRRKFGHWPLEEFGKLSMDEKHQFYELASANTTKGLIEQVVHTLSKRRIETRRSAMRGQYLPLSVWAQMGWDIASIEQNSRAEDVEEHHLGFKTYRVQVHETDEAKVEEDCRTDVMKLLENQSGKKGSSKAEALPEESAEGGSSETTEKARKRKDKDKRRAACGKKHFTRRRKQKRKCDQSSSQSSSDSSSSSKHARKRKRLRSRELEDEGKDERKRREKEELATRKREEKEKALREREEERAREKQLLRKKKDTEAFCKKAIARIAPILAKTEKLLNDSGLKEVPKHVVADAAAAKKKLVKLRALTESHIDANDFGEQERQLLANFEADINLATESNKVLAEFLATIAKHMKA